MKTTQELCNTIREIAYAIHFYLGHGHMEKVYENALAIRLKKAGLKIRQQHPVNVYDEGGALIGEYFVDLLVEDCLLLELKACQQLSNEHTVQILGYLKSTRIKDGLLINFGNYKFQIKKFIVS